MRLVQKFGTCRFFGVLEPSKILEIARARASGIRMILSFLELRFEGAYRDSAVYELYVQICDGNLCHYVGMCG